MSVKKKKAIKIKRATKHQVKRSVRKKIAKKSSKVKKSKAVKSELKTAVTLKEPLIILTESEKKPALEVKKAKSIRSTIIRDKPSIKKSPHIINLKNPYLDFSQEPDLGQNLKPKWQKQSQIKPPKVLPKQMRGMGVDFTAEKKLVSELSLVSLLRLIFGPIAGLIKKTPSKPKLISIKQLREKEIEDIFAAPIKPITQSTKKASPKFEPAEEIEDIFAPPADHKILGLQVPKNWYQPVGIFVIISLLLVLPFQVFSYYQQLQETKDNVLLLTNEAINYLKEGQKYAIAFDLDSANAQFDQAKQNFTLAQKEIDQINVVTTEILKLLPKQGKEVEAGLTLLDAGEILAEVGQILSSAGNNFLNSSNNDYYQTLLGLKTNLELGINKFWQAKILIEKIDINDLAGENQITFGQILQTLPIIEGGLTDLYALNSAILKILGQNQWQRYLVIFANNNELRGSGGFMGSFALMDIDRGQIKKMEIPGGGTYDLQGALIPKVISPEPLHLINPRWEFQDANWWPDFPTTAKKIQWFYQNANGPSTDGVILMTATLMERLLAVVGPIEMPDYGRVIDSGNFVIETQKIVELEYDQEQNRPKQFIADLAPKLLEKLFSTKGNDFKKLLAVLQQGLNEKHLLLYFNDSQIENLVLSLDWGGKLKETDGDFLSIVHTNLAGGKTDSVITETIDHQSEVLADGSIINTVKLTRTHHGIPGENIFTGVQNNSYVRFYVPAGSVLLEANGFQKPPQELFEQPTDDLKTDIDLISIETNHFLDEKTGTNIYKEAGKTVFGNWLQLKPGETKEAVIKYQLPFKLAQEGQNIFYYSLLVQKQSGSKGSTLLSSLKLNDQLNPIAKYPPSLEEEGKVIKYLGNLTTDQFYGVALIAK